MRYIPSPSRSTVDPVLGRKRGAPPPSKPMRMMSRSCSTLLCLRLWSRAEGVPSGLPFMKTAVPGTRAGEKASRFSRKEATGTEVIRSRLVEDLPPPFPGGHQGEHDGRHQEGEPAAVGHLEDVGAEEGKVEDQKAAAQQQRQPAAASSSDGRRRRRRAGW